MWRLQQPDRGVIALWPLGKEAVPCRESLTWQGACVQTPVAFVRNIMMSVPRSLPQFWETVVQAPLGKSHGMDGSLGW